MRNNKGFTLIELIATITILSIIMLIAVPNVISTINKNKNQTYVNDARKMITLAKYKFNGDANVEKPTSSHCIIFKLKALDRTELNKGPENGAYDLEKSFVVIKYDSTSKTYKYRAQIVEKYLKNETVLTKGIKLTTNEELVKVESKNSLIVSKGFNTAASIGATQGCTTTKIYPTS